MGWKSWKATKDETHGGIISGWVASWKEITWYGYLVNLPISKTDWRNILRASLASQEDNWWESLSDYN